jgi:hypothetical protein
MIDYHGFWRPAAGASCLPACAGGRASQQHTTWAVFVTCCDSWPRRRVAICKCGSDKVFLSSSSSRTLSSARRTRVAGGVAAAPAGGRGGRADILRVDIASGCPMGRAANKCSARLWARESVLAWLGGRQAHRQAGSHARHCSALLCTARHYSALATCCLGAGMTWSTSGLILAAACSSRGLSCSAPLEPRSAALAPASWASSPALALACAT